MSACVRCGGDGWFSDSKAVHHPNCDGECSDGLCPVEEQVQVECQACGGTGVEP